MFPQLLKSLFSGAANDDAARWFGVKRRRYRVFFVAIVRPDRRHLATAVVTFTQALAWDMAGWLSLIDDKRACSSVFSELPKSMYFNSIQEYSNFGMAIAPELRDTALEKLVV
jgi:hypothetical protein